jgi:hypothetical protein
MEVVLEELEIRGITCITSDASPFIFTTAGLDISSSAIKRLIRTFLDTCEPRMTNFCGEIRRTIRTGHLPAIALHELSDPLVVRIFVAWFSGSKTSISAIQKQASNPSNHFIVPLLILLYFHIFNYSPWIPRPILRRVSCHH